VTAGYSGTPQWKKLGIKPGSRVSLHAVPAGWTLTDPPEHEQTDGPADVIVAFMRSAAELSAAIEELGERIFPAGSLWIAWPRRAAGHSSDITDNVIREVVLPLGLVDVKVAAIDHDWSGVKVVWRVENRQKR